MSMLEKVARAIDPCWEPPDPKCTTGEPPRWAQDPFNGFSAAKCECGCWMSVVRPGKVQCDYMGCDTLCAAKAAIEAMREPSEKMVQAGIDEGEHKPGNWYPAMIDAALED